MPWVWVDENGQLTDDVWDNGECPVCGGQDIQVEALKRTLTTVNRQLTAARQHVVRDAVRHRDKLAYRRIWEAWKAAFPTSKARDTGVTGKRATEVFLRLERLQAGGMSIPESHETMLDAIEGAKALPFVVYGQRRAKGSSADRRIDLEQIADLSSDSRFDLLANAGAGRRDGVGGDVGF